MECPHCKHNWLPRVSKPIRCPQCHNPLNPPRPYRKKKEPSKHLPKYNEEPEPNETEIQESIKEVKQKGESLDFEL